MYATMFIGSVTPSVRAENPSIRTTITNSSVGLTLKVLDVLEDAARPTVWISAKPADCPSFLHKPIPVDRRGCVLVNNGRALLVNLDCIGTAEPATCSNDTSTKSATARLRVAPTATGRLVRQVATGDRLRIGDLIVSIGDTIGEGRKVRIHRCIGDDDVFMFQGRLDARERVVGEGLALGYTVSPIGQRRITIRGFKDIWPVSAVKPTVATAS